MKTNKIKYTGEPIGKIKIVKDFLPSPETLALKVENKPRSVVPKKRAG